MASQSIMSQLSLCRRCPKYASTPELGHVRCSKHRLCAGETGWEPEQCDACLEFRDSLSLMSTSSRKDALHQLRNMLNRMQQNIKRPNSSWRFHDKRSDFLHLASPSPAPSSQLTSAETVGSPIAVTPSPMPSPTQQPPQVVTPPPPSVQGNVSPRLVDAHQLRDVFRPLFDDMTAHLTQALSQGPISHASQTAPLMGQVVEGDPELEDEPHSRSASPASFHSRHSPSPQPMVLPSSGGTLGSSRPAFFWDLDYMWFYLTDAHRIEGHKVRLDDGKFKEFIRHPTYHDAVRPVPDTSHTDSPYMSASRAHETLASFLGADRDPSDKLGHRKRSFRLRLTDSSGLAHALRIVQNCSPSVLHSLLTDDKQNLTNTFPSSAFDDALVVNFTSGWELSPNSDYQKWAKDELLCLREASQSLSLSYIIHLPKTFLLKEKATRARLVTVLSAFGSLDKMIEKAKNDACQADSLRAIARLFLPCLKDATSLWITEKFEVRRAALQFSTTPAATRLYLSEVWEPTLFASAEILTLASTDHMRQGFKSMLGLSYTTNERFKKTPAAVLSAKSSKRKRSKSPVQKPFRPKTYSNQGQSTFRTNRPSQFKASSKSNQFPRFQQKKKKPFPGKGQAAKTNASGGPRGPHQQKS